MNLPPKTIRQQIRRNRAGTARIPLSAARPITREDSINKVTPKIDLNPPPPALDREPSQPAEKSLFKAGTNAVQKPMDSLPVLSAFQEFLDHERERMRRKILVMSLSYLFALIIIVSVSLVTGMVMVKRLKTDFQNIRTEVSKLQTLSLKAKTDAETVSERLSKETIRIRSELSSSSEDGDSKIKTLISSQNNKLDKIDSVIQALQKENILLRDNLTTMQASWMNITGDQVILRGRIEEPGARQQASPESQPIRTSSYITMSITPANLDTAVEWRIPIPE